jgi:hypothetical protein
MRRHFLLGLLASAFSVCAGLAAPPKKPAQAKTSGAFSDISMSRETGDVGGTTLFFFNNGDGDYVIIIQAEGEMRSPQISRTQIDGNNVQFVTQGQDKNLNPAMVQFRGTFSSGKLSGRFSNGDSLDLPRKNPPFMATYSDMVDDRARGKVVGTEIIRFLADKSYVLVLLGRRDMVFGEAREQGDLLQFDLRNPDGTQFSFKGRATRTFLSGTFILNGYASPIKLPAKKSIWQ